MGGAPPEPRRADVVVAVDGGGDAAEAVRTAQRVSGELGGRYPSRRSIVLLLSEGANEPALALDGGGDPRAAVQPWSHPGQGAIEAVLRAAERFDAAAVALVAPTLENGHDPGADRLVGPVLDDGFDMVCPWYATQRFEGVIGTGIVRPMVRTLFGRRLRHPLGREIALSRQAVAHLLGEAWAADPTRAGDRMWVVASILARGFRVCEAFLGAPPPRVAEPSADLAATLASVVGLLFHEMRVHAAEWQRVKGSRPVKSYGEETAPPPADARQPQVASMVSAFQLGYQELGRLWAEVLPPQTLLALKRLSREPPERFAMEDALWARIVCDCAVAYHLATMDRALLLRAMVPLYLGWAAGYVREVAELPYPDLQARSERLCAAFELAKPHLIARWRWPDRFNP